MRTPDSIRSRIRLRAWILPFLVVTLHQTTAQEPPRDDHLVPSSLVIHDRSGKPTILYRESHALLVGMSNYTGGWQRLPNVPQEIRDIALSLEAHGFEVETVIDLDSSGLTNAIQDFIANYGYDPDNRLLFLFSGHGHTRAEDKGYIVPVDAPDPVVDELEFLRRAIPMTQIMAWARQIEAKHALFLFDSCFSGTIFQSRSNLTAAESVIASITAKPTRQFLTAGSADQEVPAKSVFVPELLRAINGREAEYVKDGYLTASELALYLRHVIPSYNSGQTPQFGTISDPGLNEGDFVFKLNNAGKSVATSAVGDAPGGRVAEVSVGRPTVMDAQELNLVVPERVRRDFDVYIVSFAFTNRIEEEMLEYLEFQVSLPPDAVALDLIPFRYEGETAMMTESDWKLRQEKTISAGEHFGRDFAFAFLRPRIIAFGVGENKFAWRFEGEAARVGSQKVVAIVGVRKHIGEVTLGISTVAKLRDLWLDSGALATSEEMFTDLQLQ